MVTNQESIEMKMKKFALEWWTQWFRITTIQQRIRYSWPSFILLYMVKYVFFFAFF